LSLIAKIRAQFERGAAASAPERREDAVRRATAVLLVEAIRADHDATPDERDALVDLLQRRFGLDAGDARTLVAEAEHAADKSVSLYDFTRVLNDALDAGEKLGVVELLWRASLADGHLDKYEDYLVGKVAELLYVSRGDVVRLRNLVRGT
jgi:uncharacterized tellurite resistance protein B-like protein